MWSLWGKLRLDGAEAKKDAAKVGKSVGSSMSKDIGQQFKSGVLRFVGAGAIISLVQRQVQAAEEITKGAARAGISAEAFQEFGKAADKLGVSVEELKKLAPQLGENFEKLMTGIQKSGVMDSDTVNALNQLGGLEDKVQGKMGSVYNLVTQIAGRGWRFGRATSEMTAGSTMWLMGALGGSSGLRQAGRELYQEAHPFDQLMTPTVIQANEETELIRALYREIERLRADQNKNADRVVNTLTQ